MKAFIKICLACTFCVVLLSVGNAREPWDNPSTPEELYELYSQFTPVAVLHHMQRGALYYHKVGKEKAFEQFNRLNGESEWNTHEWYRFFAILDCKKDMMVTHPVLKNIILKSGFLSSYKEVNGRVIGTRLCNQLKKKPKGTALLIHSFWAGIKGTVRQYIMLTKVPGTQYSAAGFYASEKYTQKEVQAMLDKNTLISYDRLYEKLEGKK